MILVSVAKRVATIAGEHSHEATRRFLYPNNPIVYTDIH